MKTRETLKIDTRKFSELVSLLQKRAPHYTPEWDATDKNDLGVVLLKIFSHINEMLIHHYNQAPDKNFIAFLDMLGIKLLPAESSRVPLTFTLAKGADKEILIPDRTQASADKTDEHEEFSFETEKNLLAIYSKLIQVITVDPKEDAIYISPTKFLETEKKPKSKLRYKLVTVADKEDTKLQLDHVTDLEEKQLLKIEYEKLFEYHTIKEISGNIVILTDKLQNTFPINTKVKNIRDFTLYESKNLQEHSLYIGQEDLFNVKSKAAFIFSVSLANDLSGSMPLNLSWEYWGEKEGIEGEGWYAFQKSDHTDGFNRSGNINLIKQYRGEIKKREINGIKSRWIRCKVEDKLSVDKPRKLPVFEDIMFKVKSAGENLLPELLFNNDIPLDSNEAYYPFGKEPRTYDRFILANKEVFSKKGANVTLDLDIEPKGVLGAPAAIEIDDNTKIKVFARGTEGILIELEISLNDNTSEPQWFDRGFPEGTKIATGATPSVIIYNDTNTFTFNNTNISVFLRAKNGHLVECFYNGVQWQWFDHGTPEDEEISFDPVAIDIDGSIYVFIVGTKGNLHIFSRPFDRDIGEWHKSEGAPENSQLDSSPYVCKYTNNISIDGTIKNINNFNAKVFVKDKAGRLCIWDTNKGWEKPIILSPKTPIISSKPLAKVDSTGSLYRVYIIDSENDLWEYDSIRNWRKINIGGHKLTMDLNGHIGCFESGTAKYTYIYSRDINGSLFEWHKNGTEETYNHNSPPNLKLNSSPFLLDEYGSNPHIFALSDKNSIIERRIEDVENFIWNDYKDSHLTDLDPLLSWEYWNKNGWVVLKDLEDKTSNLLQSGTIRFDIPADMEETEVTGQKSYWIRARIVGGDYGKETFTSIQEYNNKDVQETKLISDKSKINPPIINNLTISYNYQSKQLPKYCLAYNNLTYVNHTEASVTEGKYFNPFLQLEDKDKSIYLGFEKYFKGGPIKIFFDAMELPFSDASKPKVVWSYNSEDSWQSLSYRDDTEGFIKADILQFLMPSDLSGSLRFGEYRYWIKGELTAGKYERSPKLSGIYLNTTWALQAKTIKDEIIGSSDGGVNQSFFFTNTSVLHDEKLRVREILTEDMKQFLLDYNGEESIIEISVNDKKETWVLWKEVSDFFDSRESDRHYVLDRATGEVRFGDGTHGKVPPLGDDNIKVFSYQYGGGKGGNVKSGEIKTLKSAIASVDKVINHINADGGCNTASVDQMLKIGPAMISHRNRAVSTEDFENLSKQASRKIVKARCLPNRDNNNIKKPGYVSVIIIPDSLEPKPKPSLELRRKVQKYLEMHSTNTIAHPHHIYIKEADYIEINVIADIYVTSIDMATESEYEAKSKLNTFFHPLHGGTQGDGWEFGRDVALSDIYALLEPIEGLDHIENVRFLVNETLIEHDSVKIEDNAIVANGKHTFKIKIRKGE